MLEHASPLEKAKIEVETVLLSSMWYIGFAYDAENIVNQFESLEPFPDVYKKKYASIGEPMEYDLIEFESDTYEIMGISFIKITLPEDYRIFVSRIPRIYLTYTKTEDSYDCPQFYYVERFKNEDGSEFDNLFYRSYTRDSMFESTTNGKKSEEDVIVRQYLKYAKEVRDEFELPLKGLADYLKHLM